MKKFIYILAAASLSTSAMSMQGGSYNGDVPISAQPNMKKVTIYAFDYDHSKKYEMNLSVDLNGDPTAQIEGIRNQIKQSYPDYTLDQNILAYGTNLTPENFKTLIEQVLNHGEFLKALISEMRTLTLAEQMGDINYYGNKGQPLKELTILQSMLNPEITPEISMIPQEVLARMQQEASSLLAETQKNANSIEALKNDIARYQNKE